MNWPAELHVIQTNEGYLVIATHDIKELALYEINLILVSISVHVLWQHD